MSLFVDIDSLPLTCTSLEEIKDPFVYPPSMTSSGVSKSIIYNFSCMICKEIYDNPVTTNCECQATMCLECFKKNYKKCPICRKQTNAEPNVDIKNKLALEKVPCQCGISYDYGNKSDHDVVCKLSKFYCKACGLEGNGPELLEHMFSEHYFQVLRYGTKRKNETNYPNNFFYY